MTVDLNKFAFSGIENPHAATLTEAIRKEPVENGFVLITLKTGRGIEFADAIRVFAAALRADAALSGLTDVTAYREARADELGGAVPFDQAIFDKVVADAKQRHEANPDRWRSAGVAAKLTMSNDMADWIVFVEFATTIQATAAAARWKGDDTAFRTLMNGVQTQSVDAFQNTMRYADVSRDPNVLQFFNLFPGPGDRAVLWAAWQEALPYFFEISEFRSSFPLLALDPNQKLLVVNYAHVDSAKHFFLDVCYDPNFMETTKTCYADKGFHLPLPFFCKIVPV